MTSTVTIAIDGPVATGKSVVGRLLAQRLGFGFLDTGIMYRAVTWLAMAQGVDPQDAPSLTRLARAADILMPSDGGPITVNGAPAPLDERRSEIDKLVSMVSAVPGVREALVRKQQELVAQRDMVVVGRDIGSVVAPNAPVKLYFQASARERAGRRHRELLANGREPDFSEVLADLEARDKLDSERAHSPLRPADGACIIDTDGLTVERVVERALAVIEKKR